MHKETELTQHAPRAGHPGRAVLRLPAVSLRGADRRTVAAAAAGALLLAFALGFWIRGATSAKRLRLDTMSPAKLDAAIASAQDKLRADPQDIRSLAELGTLHFRKGKDSYADAINELEEARDLGALDPRIFYCLGVMYQDTGLYSFAVEEYRRYLRNFPEDKEIRLLEAKLLYKQGNFSEAVEEYERLKFRYPKDTLVEENLGLSLWGAKDMDRAVASFMQLLTAGPDQAARAHFYLGQISFDKGDYKAALEQLLKAQPEPPRDIGIPQERLFALLGACYQKLSLWPDAKAAWERVLTLTPNDAKAKAALREVNRRLPRHKTKKP